MGKLDGVYGVEIRQNVRDIKVHYAPDKTGVDEILAALDAAGESAKKK